MHIRPMLVVGCQDVGDCSSAFRGRREQARRGKRERWEICEARSREAGKVPSFLLLGGARERTWAGTPKISPGIFSSCRALQV